jgi:hypothetical protein
MTGEHWMMLSAFLSGAIVGELIHLAFGIWQWRRALRRQRQFQVKP